MSAERIIEVMEALVSVHQALNEQAKEKTEILKNGDMKGLEALMKSEEAAVTRLEKLEETREREVEQFFSEKQILTEDTNLSQLMGFVSSEENRELLRLQSSLLAEINALKEQNALNQELIEQSLQFVNVSLNLLDPREEVSGYRPPDQAKEPMRNGRSLFDSKA